MTKAAFLKELGKRIKALREEHKISQSDLARECDKDRQSISRLEKGLINPTAYYLYEVAMALKVTYGELLDIKD